jgi:hypothetical protein
MPAQVTPKILVFTAVTADAILVDGLLMSSASIYL